MTHHSLRYKRNQNTAENSLSRVQSESRSKLGKRAAPQAEMHDQCCAWATRKRARLLYTVSTVRRLFGAFMRAVAAFSLSIALALSPAAAADKNHPVDQPSRNWTGLYVGAFLGYGRGETDIATNVGVPTATSYFTSVDNIASVEGHGTGSLSEGVPLAGIQVGANIQAGAVVFGVEADFGTFRMSQSVGATDFTYPTFAATYTMRASMEADWLFTLRARAGVTPRPDLLIYATGGLAVTDLTVSNAFRDNAPSDGLGGTSTTDLRFGWTAGGGIEWAMARNWSLKAEYLYLDLGSATARSTVTCAPPTPNLCTLVGRDSSPFVSSADLIVHTVRVGLNYRF